MVCDTDYRGEYIIALHNNFETTRIVQSEDRIAQLIYWFKSSHRRQRLKQQNYSSYLLQEEP